jgi:hypothetical protein
LFDGWHWNDPDGAHCPKCEYVGTVKTFEMEDC